MIANDIAPIDLLVVNLYPFEATLSGSASFEDRIENIDIGGPAMIRAAAKNHDDVAVIVDVDDYPALIDELRLNEGATSLAFRRRMAQKAFARTAAYDAAISNWLAREIRGARAEMARLRRRSAPKLRRAALRRESASERGAVPDRRDAPRRRGRAPGPGQGAVLQQHQRHRRGLRARRPNSIRPKAPRSRSSSTPTRAASRSARRCSRPTRRRSPAIRSRPSAASSRSTGGSTRPARARSSRSSPRSSSRRRRTTRRWRSSRRRRTCGSCSPARCPIRARRRSPCDRSPAASWSRIATTARSKTGRSRS